MTAFSRLSVAATFAALLCLPLFAQDEKKEEPAKTTPAPLKVPEEKGEKPAGEKPAAEKPGEAKPAEVAPAKPVDPLVEWKRLADRKLEIFNTLQGLKKKFAVAKDNDAKRIIRNEYTDLIREFEADIYSQMIDLADAAWAADSTILDAGELALRNAFNANRFEDARAVAAKLLEANRRTREVFQIAYTSEFAGHNFEKAAVLVEEMIQVYKPGNPQETEYWENYIQKARKYVDFWKQEQAIRETEAALKGDAALPRVTLQTDRGEIIVELFEDQAPNTVASFIQTVEEKKYDAVEFHQVEPQFMAQTGNLGTADEDPLNDQSFSPGFTIPCECYRDGTRMHFQGSLSMALPENGKDRGSTQFFITHLPTHWLNYEDGKTENNHTVFGRVVQGMDIVWATREHDVIETAKVLRKRPHEYKAERILEELDIDPDGTLDPKKTTEGDSKTPEKTTEKKPAEGDKKEADKTEPEKKETPKTEPAKKEAVEKKPADPAK